MKDWDPILSSAGLKIQVQVACMLAARPLFSICRSLELSQAAGPF